VASADDLTLTYLAGHPAEAAQVLETLPRAASVALLARVPARIGAPVLEALGSSSAAGHLVDLEPERATALLGTVRVQTAAAALRHVPEPRRAALLDGMPTARALACRLLLGHPEWSVGAWADPDVVVFGPDTRVDEAIARLGQEGDRDISDGLYVADPGGRLLGVVAPGDLLRAPVHLRLDGLMRPPPTPLPAAMRVTAALRWQAWDETLSLPVIDRRGRLVGRVPRMMLARATAPSRASSGEGGALVAVMASAYWNLVSGLLAAAVSMLPSPTPVERAGR
jgi:Mg/Co/Ni transporter MgtE